MMNPRSRRRRSLQVPEVNLTPLIDTALTLLVIFMVTAPLVNNAIKINLPTGKAAEEKNKQQEYIVYIEKPDKQTAEKLYFNGKRASNKEQLITLLKQEIGNAHDKTVFVKADTTANYGFVVEIVDEIKVVGGISYVALATKRS